MSREELLLELGSIVVSKGGIKDRADEIQELRESLQEYLTDAEKTEISNKIKATVQIEAETAFVVSKGWGAIIMATGTGKSKIAVDLCIELLKERNYLSNILVVVPTEKLRDENWKDEFDKWGSTDAWSYIKRCCYASLNKYNGLDFDFVILDEGHNITENNSEFFKNNTVRRCLMLTATEPKDLIKINILKSLGILPVYKLTLDESVKLGLVAPYDITIVDMKLDNVDNYFKAGSKKKPFNTTESKNYNYLSRICYAAPSKFSFIKRMQFIYNLRSKTNAAKQILEKIIPKELRTLIFCGSKRQAIEVCERRFFSKPTLTRPKGDITQAKADKHTEKLEEYMFILKNYEEDRGFNDFKSGKINSVACVDSVNEGHNIPDVDCAFIVQLNSNDLNLIQRIGRTIRFKAGHIAKIIILCCVDSVDNDWVAKSTGKLSAANIRRVALADLLSGVETINFD